MTQREKLVELLNKQKGYTLPIWTAPQTIEIMADALIANGVIVPPCKVGDKFYYLGQFAVKGEIKNNFQVFENVVYSIEEFENDLIIYDERGMSYGADCIFSTKGEAEKALAEKRTDNG